jgi:CRP/FNR family transcriptional regulator, cyclic AMP receptor protein
MDRPLFDHSLLLGGLAPDEQARVAASMRRQSFRRGEVVVRQGDPGVRLHLVLEGHLKVLVSAESGDEVVLTILGPGDVFGEIALLDGGPRSASVIALSHCRTASLNRDEFLALLRQRPSVLDSILVVLARMLRRETDDLAGLVSLSVSGRLAKRLLDLAEAHGTLTEGVVEIGLAVTQEELAAMVGATRASVNQVLGSLEDLGAISRRGRRIAVIRPEVLRHVVQAS